MSTVVKQNKRIHLMGLKPGSPHCKSTSWTPPLSTLYVKKVSFIVAPPEGNWVEEWETQHSILHWFNFRWNSQAKFWLLSVSINYFVSKCKHCLFMFQQIFITNCIALLQLWCHFYMEWMNCRHLHYTHLLKKWYIIITFLCSSYKN